MKNADIAERMEIVFLCLEFHQFLSRNTLNSYNPCIRKTGKRTDRRKFIHLVADMLPGTGIGKNL